MTSQHPLANSLLVNAPAEELTDELQLFGRFVGSWTVLCQNARGALEGEVYFGWVLGGRAVQDVWLVPGRAQSGPGQPPYQFHGSTLRFFDRTLGSWRSTWIEPVNGRVRRLSAARRATTLCWSVTMRSRAFGGRLRTSRWTPSPGAARSLTQAVSGSWTKRCGQHESANRQ